MVSTSSCWGGDGAAPGAGGGDGSRRPDSLCLVTAPSVAPMMVPFIWLCSKSHMGGLGLLGPVWTTTLPAGETARVRWFGSTGGVFLDLFPVDFLATDLALDGEAFLFLVEDDC